MTWKNTLCYFTCLSFKSTNTWLKSLINSRHRSFWMGITWPFSSSTRLLWRCLFNIFCSRNRSWKQALCFKRKTSRSSFQTNFSNSIANFKSRSSRRWRHDWWMDFKCCFFKSRNWDAWHDLLCWIQQLARI